MGRFAAAAAVFLAGVLVSGGSAAAADEPRYFRLGTAATGGTYFQIGGVLASALSRPPGAPSCDRSGACGVPGLVAVAQATQGSVENLRLMATGQIESGLTQADVASWAYAGTNGFAADGPMRRLRAIGSLFPESVHLVVGADAPIRSLAELPGRHISLGELKSGTIASARLVLDEAGVKESDLRPEYLRLPQAAESIRERTLDGFFLIGGAPVPAILELAATTPIRLVPVETAIALRMKRQFGYYTETAIPAGTYARVGETPTVGIGALLVVLADADDELIYAITRALWSDGTARLLTARSLVGKAVRLENALKGLPVPLHPGAERFYREAGMPPEPAPPPKPD